MKNQYIYIFISEEYKMKNKYIFWFSEDIQKIYISISENIYLF